MGSRHAQSAMGRRQDKTRCPPLWSFLGGSRLSIARYIGGQAIHNLESQHRSRGVVRLTTPRARRAVDPSTIGTAAADARSSGAGSGAQHRGGPATQRSLAGKSGRRTPRGRPGPPVRVSELGARLKPGTQHKRALVAVAHRIALRIHEVLSTGKPYEADRGSDPTPTQALRLARHHSRRQRHLHQRLKRPSPKQAAVHYRGQPIACRSSRRSASPIPGGTLPWAMRSLPPPRPPRRATASFKTLPA
jgi:hypothetical protein